MLDWLDLAELDELAAAARSAIDAGNHVIARNAGEAALALVRGPVLSDEGDWWWVDEERAAVKGDRDRAALATGNVGEAIARAETALDADPADEVALRVLMSAHARSKRPGSASAAYDKLWERLAEDFGLSLSRETDAVHAAIVAGELGPTIDAQGAPTLVTLSGRDAELTRLETAIAEPAAMVHLVQVEGEAADRQDGPAGRLRQRVRARDALVLRGRCDETGQLAASPSGRRDSRLSRRPRGSAGGWVTTASCSIRCWG